MLQQQKNKAAKLWIAYMQCKDITKATALLLQWQKQMDIVHATQSSIIDLFSNNLHNDDTENYLYEVLRSDQNMQ